MGEKNLIQPVHLRVHNLPEAWFQAIYHLFDPGVTRKYTVEHGSFVDETRLEYGFITIVIDKPSLRPLIPDIPAGLGIPTPTDMEYVEQYFVDYILGDYKAEGEQYTYGERINISLPRVIEMLRTTPNTNQAVIEIARPEDIHLDDPPCLRKMQFKIFNGELVMYVSMRSNDLWSGFPANLAAFQMLKEYMADDIGCLDGPIVYMSEGLHVYGHSEELAKIRAYRS